MRIIPSKNSAIDLSLAQRLMNLRKAKSLTIEQAAELSGVSRATLSRIERGETSPTAHVMGRLSSLYGLTLSQLLVGLDDNAPDLIKWQNSQKWEDVETGFIRTLISPPSRGFDVEIMHGSLPVGARIDYNSPPLDALEQHIIVLQGQLDVSFNHQDYRLGPLDCLRVKLHGPSQFSNTATETVAYLIASKAPS